MKSASGMHDTIAAIATPAGSGGVAIVRVSGPESSSILRQIVPDWPDETPSHHLRLSRIFSHQGHILDEGLVVFFKSPASYTGEDVVEFQCHGGPVIMQGVLDAAVHFGARVAGPGEFTQRAYLNGQLDLTQAEAVADLINATSASAHKLAMEHLQGDLGDAVRVDRDLLFEAATLIEAALDFSHEEHVYQIERDEVLTRVNQVYAHLCSLRASFDQGRRQREGIRVVLTGPTNAGKSTLFNALHGSDRAIVTSIAGTTRDFLEEEIILNGISLRLIDTAGLRQTDDEVEAIGIERSRQWVQKADIVIRMFDRALPLSDEDRQAFEQLKQEARPVIVIANKADLPTALSQDDTALVEGFERYVSLSLHEGQANEGFAQLKNHLSQLAAQLTQSEGVLLSRARHKACVVEAITALERAQQALEMGMDHELVALDVREALDALGQMVGYVSTDDILHRIFAEFCVGK